MHPLGLSPRLPIFTSHPLPLSAFQYSYKYIVLPKSIFSINMIMIPVNITDHWNTGTAFPFLYSGLFSRKLIIVHHKFFPHSPTECKNSPIGFSTLIGASPLHTRWRSCSDVGVASLLPLVQCAAVFQAPPPRWGGSLFPVSQFEPRS